jgi:mono/diheme cytochrome c family protein
MKKPLKVVLYLLALAIVAIAGLLTYVKAALPDVGDAEDLKIEATPERIERGKYLANNVSGCVVCHSERDWNTFGGPLMPGSTGKGGELFGKTMGFPGDFYARNITPYGIGGWTDGEVFRAITTGVSKDGHALFPIMPYETYGKMDREDIYSIIAYIRTLEPVTNDVAASSSDFPMNFIINTIPHTANFGTIPPKTDVLAYGKYMFHAALCEKCHTPTDQGAPIEGKFMAGGTEFPFPDGSVVRSANITSDNETGIGTWTEEMFMAKIKMFADSSYTPAKVAAGEFKTVMPWAFYCHMKDEDLKAIFAYVKTIPPVSNKVVKFENAVATN